MVFSKSEGFTCAQKSDDQVRQSADDFSYAECRCTSAAASGASTIQRAGCPGRAASCCLQTTAVETG